MRPLVFILFCSLGLASWIDIYGVYVELPLMVNQLPEGWSLPSYLVIINQLSNVGPLIYFILKKLLPRRVKEWPTIILIISIGIISCVLLAFFWNVTTVVSGPSTEGGAGREASTYLFALTCLLSLVDCTSSVVFLPYMALYHAQYLTALFIGEGLSGLIPALIGLIQGVGGDAQCINETRSVNGSMLNYEVVAYYPEPRFSVSVFFIIMAGLLCTSFLSFIILHFTSCGKSALIPVGGNEKLQTKNENIAEANLNETCKKNNTRENGDVEMTLLETSCQPTADNAIHSLVNPVQSSINSSTQMISGTNSVMSPVSPKDSLTQRDALVSLLLIGWTNALTNAILPSFQSFSVMPYGNFSYTLSVRLSVLVNPLACMIALFKRTGSLIVLGIFTGVGTLLTVYHVVLAAYSPYPPLSDEAIGAVLSVSTYVLTTALFSYTKLCCAYILSEKAGSRGLFWCGGVEQIASLAGAILTFLLINQFNLFTGKYPCS